MSVIKPILQHPDQIAYFTGANNYSWLHFRNGEKKLLAKPISYIADKLPDFIRIHKTALINPVYVRNFQLPTNQKMAGAIQLENGDMLPVSRRRCQQVAELLAASTANERQITEQKPVDFISQSTVNQPELPLQSIFLITNDAQSEQLLKQTLGMKWLHYQVHTTRQSVHLPDLFSELTQPELPTLLILDARTTTLERMHTLQRLKEDQHLRRIPVILLVLPTDQSVTAGYQRQANSVISLPEGDPSFAQAIERICQFWLRTAALPGTVG